MLIGEVIGAALVLFVALALVLAIGKSPQLRRHALAVHVAGVAVVWLLAVASTVSYAPAAAYLMTLPAIWSYRREVKKAPSGWYRLGMVLTAAWLLIWSMLALNTTELGAPSESEIAGFSWFFSAVGITIWLVGWAVQWVRDGFRSGAKRANADEP